MADPPPASANTLEAMLAKRQQLEEDLVRVERGIFELEEVYLEDTSSYGNVVKGWDGFLTSRPKPHSAAKRATIAYKERIFSKSSTTAPRLDGEGEGEDGEGGGGGGGHGGGLKGEAKEKSHHRTKTHMSKDGHMSD